MDLPLVIFCGVLSLLVVAGLAAMFLFQKPRRPAAPREESTSDSETPETVALTRLELQAEELTRLATACSGKRLPEVGFSLFRVRIGSLIEDAPRSAIVKAWRELESASLQTLALYDYGTYPVKRLRSIEMMGLLRDNEIFSETQLEICRQLEAIRNEVFGITNSQVSRRAAAQAIEAIDWLISCLEEFRHSVMAAQQRDLTA